MDVTIKRVSNTYNSGCFGALLINNVPYCVTLEETWLDNIPNESCIPAGCYKVVKHNSHKFGDVWKILNVEGRTDILMHIGNTELDSTGCVLLGKYFADFGDKRGVADSKNTLNMLKSLLPDEFMLTIEDCF